MTCLRSSKPRKAARNTRCWIASMVEPCLPISSPRSSPFTVARISSALSSMSTVARRPSAWTTRPTIARTRSAGSSGISSATTRQASGSTSARTRAGRSGSESSATSKLTQSAVSPGKRDSSVFIAAHFASPRLSPSASVTSSSRPGSSLTDIVVRASAPAPRALLLLARGAGRRLGGPAVALARDLRLGLAFRNRLRLRGRAAVRERSRRGGLPACGLLLWDRIARVKRLRLRIELLDEQLLPNGPNVRRDPVDDQSGREVDDEDDEDEGQREHDSPLHGVRADGRDRARRQLRADVEHDHHAQENRVRDVLREVVDRQEAGVVGDVGLERVRLQQREQCDEERDLEEQREAGAQRVHLLPLVEGHDLLVHALLVVLVALLEPLHRLHALERERQDQQPDREGHHDDRDAPTAGERVARVNQVMPELQDPLAGVDERL